MTSDERQRVQGELGELEAAYGRGVFGLPGLVARVFLLGVRFGAVEVTGGEAEGECAVVAAPAMTWRVVLDEAVPGGTVDDAAARALVCGYRFFVHGGAVYDRLYLGVGGRDRVFCSVGDVR